MIDFLIKNAIEIAALCLFIYIFQLLAKGIDDDNAMI
jgi:hypothetical protein